MDWVGRLGRHRLGRVLVIDEQDHSADEVARVAHEAGAECVRCRGENGMRLLHDSIDADVVFWAWHGGHDWSEHVVERVHELGYRGPVIAVVDRFDPGVIQDARAAGADDVIVQPLSPSEVRSALGRWARSE